MARRLRWRLPRLVGPFGFQPNNSTRAFEYPWASEVHDVAREIGRVLRPGGHCVLTIDLFLNLRPFCSRESNEFGTNIDVAAFVDATGLDLVVGERSELHGFPEFDPDRIMAELDRFVRGRYPCLVQALVLRKPTRR